MLWMLNTAAKFVRQVNVDLKGVLKNREPENIAF